MFTDKANTDQRTPLEPIKSQVIAEGPSGCLKCICCFTALLRTDLCEMGKQSVKMQYLKQGGG